jgi:hypothetical protein
MEVSNVSDGRNGEPYVFKEDTVKNHICCDCGLVHFIHVGVVAKKKAHTYWYRDDYQTTKERKRIKKATK